MSLQTWKCVTCEKNFKQGEWICADGMSNHVVEEKVYRSLDVPTAEGRLAEGSLKPVIRSRTRVCNIPPDKQVKVNGELQLVPGGFVELINGVYATSDPEIQYWMDKKRGYQATKEQWEGVWLSKDELLADRELKLRAAEQRLENDRNELLSKTKKEKGVAA